MPNFDHAHFWQSSNLFLRKAKKTNSSNYRPIALLPLLSKVLERVIHDQINAFLKENNLLYNYQSGFRTNHLTNLCLPFLADKILRGFDEGLLTGMMTVYLQKHLTQLIMKFVLKTQGHGFLWRMHYMVSVISSERMFLWI